MRLLITALCALSCLLVSTANAQVRPGGGEAGLYAGGWEGDAIFESAATYGVRGRYDINSLFGVEGTVGVVSTKRLARETDGIEAGDALLTQTGLNAVMHLSYSALTPYLSAGVGAIVEEELHLAGNVAFGATYHINDLLGIRAEGRGWFSKNAPSTDQFDHFEATLGLSFQFGGNNDIDGDGIVNRLDDCPVTAEDKDGIDDTDGCVEEPPKDEDKDKDEKSGTKKEVKAAAEKATKELEAPAAPATPPAPVAAEPAPAPAAVPPAAPADDCKATCEKDKSGAELEACLAKCDGKAAPADPALDAKSDAAVEDMEKEMKKADE